MKSKIEILLQDMSYNTKYEILDYGTHKEEISSIALKRGIRLPAHDLSVFKGTYAFVDRANLNGCTLPKEEVEKALDTLVGKAVDFDHLRERVVGYWVDAKLDGDQILAYGVFFKGNFREDYTTISELLQKDILGISFEAWGNREYTSEQEYNLRDIEFAGGALLIKTKPAFPGSEVLEMANKRVLEFASVMIEPKSYLHIGTIHCECVKCGHLLLSNKKCLSEMCPECGGLMKNKKEEKEIKIVKEVKDNKGEQGMKTKLERDMTYADWEQAIKTLTDLISVDSGKRKIQCTRCNWVGLSTELAKSTKCPTCGGSCVLVSDTGNIIIESNTGGDKMEEKIKELEKENAKLKEDLLQKTQEVETANQVIATLKTESDAVKTKIEEIEKTKGQEIAKAREEAMKVAQRRTELGEIAEKMKDEEILNEDKFEKAKLEKQLKEKDAEIAKLKDGKGTIKDLDKGSTDKSGQTIFDNQDKVKGYAWGK